MKTATDVVKVIPAKKGRWEIYVTVEIIPLKRNKSVIKKQYGTRLISRNGKIICGNTGFNTIAIAKKNIKAVQASA